MAAERHAGGAWPPVLTIEPIAHAQGELRVPGSKSMSNRALLLAALAEGTTQLEGLLVADDTLVMIGALRALGVPLTVEGESACVEGCAGRFPVRGAELNLGNAGTAMRPLAAALAFAGGNYRLDGVARMRERPIGDLVDALRALGARIDYLAAPGYPPLRIAPPEGASSAGTVGVRGTVSSQFVSALLMAAPARAAAAGLRVQVEGALVSQPYVAMTLAMMRAFGAPVQREGNAFLVTPATYRSPGRYAIEGDASGASYFLALGAVAGGPVRVLGVGSASVQGDIAFARWLEQMGARVAMGADWIEARSAGAPLRGIDADATPIPDAAMTAAVAALFARGATRLRGIGSWRVKETDRIHAMAAELGKLGAQVRSGADWLEITPPGALREAIIDTYDDHRMAMCLALAAAGGNAVHIRDPGCVAKTFPDFFDRLERLCAPFRA